MTTIRVVDGNLTAALRALRKDPGPGETSRRRYFASRRERRYLQQRRRRREEQRLALRQAVRP